MILGVVQLPASMLAELERLGIPVTTREADVLPPDVQAEIAAVATLFNTDAVSAWLDAQAEQVERPLAARFSTTKPAGGEIGIAHPAPGFEGLTEARFKQAQLQLKLQRLRCGFAHLLAEAQSFATDLRLAQTQ